MNIEVNDGHFNNSNVPMTIFFTQWLRLKLLGRVKVFEAMKKGWRGPLPFYVTQCDSCREYFLDYPHSWDERLDCPTCNKREGR